MTKRSRKQQGPALSRPDPGPVGYSAACVKLEQVVYREAEAQ